MKALTPQVNVAEEQAAIVEHLTRTWRPYEHWTAVVAALAQRALGMGKYWFDEHGLFHVSHDTSEARKERLVAAGMPYAEVYYDAAYHYLSQLSYSARAARDAVMKGWDYERRVKQALTPVRSAFPDLADQRPLGWDKPEERRGLSYEQLKDMFSGSDTARAAACDFVERVSLDFVEWQHQNQGQAPVTILGGAIIAHFLTIAETLNNAVIAQDIQRVADMAPTQFSLDYVPVYEHPMLQLMVKHCRAAPTAPMLEEAREAHKKYEALSQEEKDARQKESEEELLRSVKERDPEMDAFMDELHKREAALSVDIRAVLFGEAPKAPKAS